MTIQIDHETIRTIRKAIVIGLQYFGEIERLLNAAELSDSHFPNLRPVHPTGNADTVGDFADALAYLELIESNLSEEGRQT